MAQRLWRPTVNFSSKNFIYRIGFSFNATKFFLILIREPKDLSFTFHVSLGKFSSITVDYKIIEADEQGHGIQ